MNVQPERYPFLQMDPASGVSSSLPYLPLALRFQHAEEKVVGLVDTGSAVNVLPYDVGLRLGAIWQQQTIPLQLTGNLAALEARALLLSATVGQFAPVSLAFAWTQSNAPPVILGQVNFFMEFDVCLFRSQGFFEIKPKQAVQAAPPSPAS
jgi:hypothetical protein